MIVALPSSANAVEVPDFASAFWAIPTTTNTPPVQNANIRLLPLGGKN